MLLRVSRARARTGIKAPATSGHPDFERAYRIQMNTLEGMPLFLPPLWLAAIYVDDRFAAVLGLVWIVGRFLYMRAYTVDPARRAAGFIIQSVASSILFVAALAEIFHSFFE